MINDALIFMAMTAQPEVLSLTLSLKERMTDSPAAPLWHSHFLCPPLPLINSAPPTSL